MNEENRPNLSHVYWLGGATDACKSTTADQLAEHYGLHVYHYDRYDLAHHEELSKVHPDIDLSRSDEESWLRPTPEALMQRTLVSFERRFPLVIRDLLALPIDRPILAEGFGLTPALVQPHLAAAHQAIWFVPTEKFKNESMDRRGKPSFSKSVSDPAKARYNLLTRDRLLAEWMVTEVREHGGRLVEIDGSKSTDKLVALLAGHFRL